MGAFACVFQTVPAGKTFYLTESVTSLSQAQTQRQRKKGGYYLYLCGKLRNNRVGRLVASDSWEPRIDSFSTFFKEL